MITKQKEKTMARTPIHPGEILGDELEEIGLSAKRLADVIEVPPNRLYQILAGKRNMTADTALRRSEEHTSELQSHLNLVCRLLLEKKKKIHEETAISKR